MEGRRDLPVDGCLPGGVEEAVEHVKEHGPDVTRVLEVEADESLGIGGSSGVGALVGVATAPDGHGEDEEIGERGFGLD